MPRPLVISLLLLTNATSRAMTKRDCSEGFGHSSASCCSAASTAQSHHPLRREIHSRNLNEVLWKCHLPTLCCHLGLQWNLSITDTLGTTSSVPTKEVSLLQRLFCTLLYVAGTMNSVPIKEVSLFRRSLIERFHCI